MKILCSILLTVVFVLNMNAQAKTSEPLNWKEMTIDINSSNDVIEKFGNPEKEEIDRLDVLDT